MLKYLLPLLVCVSCAAQSSKPNLVTVAANQQAEAQKMAASIEATNNATPDDVQTRLRQQQVANAVMERHAQLQSDTEKLVALTAELKQHVDKAGMNFLSMEVIKKAQEIQKLAKSVQDKMKNAY
jgi:hypothetical protein